MKPTPYTPGPWKAEHGVVHGQFRGTYITRDVSDGEKYVARMDGSTHADWFNIQGNMRLIASAPELFEALKDHHQKVIHTMQMPNQCRVCALIAYVEGY